MIRRRSQESRIIRPARPAFGNQPQRSRGDIPRPRTLHRGRFAFAPRRANVPGMRLAVFISALALVLFGAPSGARAEGSPEKGRKIATTHCARCHVVGDFNPYGGIGSTPSFQLLARRDDYLERFQTFFERRPHPAYVRVPGVPKWTNLPSYAAEFEVRIESIEDIIAFVRTLRPDE